MFSEKPERSYKPIFSPSVEQPWSEYGRGHGFNSSGRPKNAKGMPVTAHNVIRDQLTISTWLLLGASLQCVLLAVFGSRLWTLVLPGGMLAFRFVHTLLQVFGWAKNPQMEGVIHGMASCHFPDEQGEYTGTPSNAPVAVLHITARSNHPLGLLAPGFKEIGGYFDDCVKWLEEDADARGFLGMTQWINVADRKSCNEIMTIGYFNSVEAIHALAHHAVHTAAWKYWNQNVSKFDHLTITHEIFFSQPGQWEAIYGNAKPTCLGSTIVKGSDGKWRSPLVRISGPLKTSAGRMNLDQTEEQKQRLANAHEATGAEEVYKGMTP